MYTENYIFHNPYVYIGFWDVRAEKKIKQNLNKYNTFPLPFPFLFNTRVFQHEWKL